MDQTLPIGAHLVTPRRWYSHHGVYIGNGRVVHYAGLSGALRRGPIEEITLDRFAGRWGFRIQPHASPAFSPDEIVRRALARLGENRYGLFSNNCEHFCEWCIGGTARSSQIESIIEIPGRLSRAIARRLVRLPASLAFTPSPARRARA